MPFEMFFVFIIMGVFFSFRAYFTLKRRDEILGGAFNLAFALSSWFILSISFKIKPEHTDDFAHMCVVLQFVMFIIGFMVNSELFLKEKHKEEK